MIGKRLPVFLGVYLCLCYGSSMSIRKEQMPSNERYYFFDTELFKVLSQDENKNFLMSPVSIKLLLGMLMEGGNSATSDEIRAALRLPNGKENARKEFEAWLSLLQIGEHSNTLKLASRLFLSNRYSVTPDYADTLKKYYNTGVTTVKFNDPRETSRTINNWVAENTNHLIPSIIKEGQIKANAKLMLTSAIYFKEAWMTPFNRDKNNIKCFYTKDNKCQTTSMMTDTGNYKYGYISQLDAKAIQLPYKGGKYSMLILLPTDINGVEELSRDLVHVSLNSILSEITTQEVYVQLPQFEVSYDCDLVESLKKIQITTMFGKKANFSSIMRPGHDAPAVNHIFHSAKISVNEEGTEAAAASGAFFVPLMGGTTTTFVANHPFLFFVMDTAVNSVLFAGKLSVPKLVTKPVGTTTMRSHSDINNSVGSSHRNQPTATTSISSGTSSQTIKFFLDSSTLPTPEALKSSKYGHTQKPKFRSIKEVFSQTKAQSLSQVPGSISDLSKGRDAYLNEYMKKSLQSDMAVPILNGEGYKSKPLPTSRQVKHPSHSPDDWRHHVLFFT